MKNGSQLNFPFVTIVHNTGFEESRFYYWRKKLTETMLPQAGGFVPVNLFNRNGKLGMSATGNPKEATDHVL